MADRRVDSLWLLVAAPAVWSGYFLAVYIVGAIRCEVADSPLAGIGVVQVVVAALGVLSLAAIGGVGLVVWRRMTRGFLATEPQADDSRQSRGVFLAHATLMLCGLSIVATIYVALPALFVQDCR